MSVDRTKLNFLRAALQEATRIPVSGSFEYSFKYEFNGANKESAQRKKDSGKY